MTTVYIIHSEIREVGITRASGQTMFRKLLVIAATLASLSVTVLTTGTQINVVTSVPHTLRPLSMTTGGRTSSESTGDGASVSIYQWPGAYFEAAFKGNGVYFRIVSGNQILHVLVDDQPPIALIRPASGLYQIGGLNTRKHAVRIEVATESQDAPGVFGGFTIPPHVTALAPPKRTRQIEFIGDSYTVGYGNLSLKTECTREEVWATTDNTHAFGPLTAKHYHADYQINAISGRGVVRNYNGYSADPLPVAYPFIQLDGRARYEDDRWHPQIMVIGLGTNDFSTQLNPGEKWSAREELDANYEAAYVQFLRSLRARNPAAFFILMATDGAHGEIESEVRKVMTELAAEGEHQVAFIPMHGLAMTGCDSHPSAADDQTISALLIQFLDGHPQLWQGR